MHTHDQAEDAFGFGAVRNSTKDKIKQIRPTAPPEPPPDFAKLDAIAGSAGFVSREAQGEYDNFTRRGRPRAPEPTVALNMRAPMSVAKAFQRWCEVNRYSYPAALAEIMRQAGIPTE